MQTRVTRKEKSQGAEQGAEYVTSILNLYPAERLHGDESRRKQGVDLSEVTSLIENAHENYRRRERAGDAVAVAVMRLTPPTWSESDCAAAIIEQSLLVEDNGTSGASDDPDANRLGWALYDRAAADVEGGRTDRAAVLLATLLYLGVAVADALAGLAVCGARLGKFEEALVLATECLKLPIKHPRAFFVAGWCEIRLGNLKAAQLLLATAARFARTRPEFRGDLQAAQRLLLAMHFG